MRLDPIILSGRSLTKLIMANLEFVFSGFCQIRFNRIIRSPTRVSKQPSTSSEFCFWLIRNKCVLAAKNMQATSDDHSELEPRLPIPNRTVKRFSADDSADYPCESRTSSGTHYRICPVLVTGLFFVLYPSKSVLARPHQLATEFSDFQGFFSRKSLI